MALMHIQSMLARIYTDEELRRKFFCNPYEVALEFNLEDSEIEQIIILSKEQVESFSTSLIYKRLAEIRKKLSLTSQLLGNKFSRLFFQFATISNPKGIKKHLEDTFLFSKYIKRVAINENISSCILEIMDFEIYGMKVFLFPIFINIRIFRYDMNEMLDSLFRNDKVYPKSRFCIGIWFKVLSFKRVYLKSLI